MNSRPPSDNQPPPPPPSPREELEARLTALALGEAGAFEAETLRARIAAEPDLAALYQRIQAAILAYKNTFEDERAAAHLPPLEPAPEHLSPERAARLAQLFASTQATVASTPEKNSPPQHATRKIIPFPFLVQVLGAVACLMLLAFLTETNFSGKLGPSPSQLAGSAEHRVASVDGKKTSAKQKKLAEISLPLKDKDTAHEVMADNFAVANNNAASAPAAVPSILSAVQLANSVAADNANAQGATSANSLSSDQAKTEAQQLINFSAGTPTTTPAFDYAVTSPESLAPTNPPFGASPDNKQAADQPAEETALPGFMATYPSPPPPPPALVASTPGANIGSAPFGGRGGRSLIGRGGRGGAVASINPPAAASAAAAPSPEPAAASPASGANDTVYNVVLAGAGNLTIAPGTQEYYTGVLGGTGNLTIASGTGGNSNNFVGNAASLPSSGPADAGGLADAAGSNARADNSLKTGTRSWVVDANNTYMGNTTISNGQLAVSGNNTYTGATTLNGGKFSFGTTSITLQGGGLSGNQTLSFGELSANQNYAESNLGGGQQPASGLSFNGGKLQWTGPAGSTDTPLGIGGSGTLVKESDSFIVQGKNSITLQGGGLQWAANLTNDPLGNNENFANSISGNNTVVKAGAGTLNLSGNNTVSGVLTVAGGTLNNTNQNTPDFKVVQTGDSLQGNSGTGQEPFTVGGQTFGRGVITKSGNGTLILDQNNTYSGTTNVTAGTLQLGDAIITGTNNFNGHVTLNAGTLDISNSLNGQQSTAFGIATNNVQELGLTKVGAGELTLSSGNTYRGTTLITGGAINFAAQSTAGQNNTANTVVLNNPVQLRTDNLTANQLPQQQNTANYLLQGGNLQTTGRAAAPAQQIANIITAPAAPAAAPVPALQQDQPVARPPSDVKFPAPVATVDNAFSTFALNVNDASYQLARTALQNHRWPDPATTRTEEFLNAFRYHDPLPATGEACALHYDLARNPVESGDLLRVSFQTAAAGRDRLTPLHLTILLDDSGSMTRADRVATVQAALRALGSLLRADDEVSLVTFARTPTVRATALTANHFNEILALAGSIEPEGGTNMEEALRTAYATARQTYDEHAQNRVILLTDGAANLGELDPAALAGIVEENRKAGIALDAYGVGWDGYDDTTLEALTRKSDGRYAFLNGPQDVNAAFAAKLAGALTPAANDVKLQIEFNPRRVTTYRLMGYNNLRMTKEQFRDNTVSAGELAAADQGTALYNLILNSSGVGPIGTARARYRDPGTTTYHEVSWTIPYNGLPVAFDQASPALRLAAVAGYFAEYLQQSPYASGVTPRELLNLLRGVPEAFSPDARPAGLAETLNAAASLAGN